MSIIVLQLSVSFMRSLPFQMFSYAVLGLAVIASSSVVTAQKFKTADPVVDVSEDSRQLDDFLTKLALDAMPVNYVEDKDWGMQVERWDGVKIRIEDGKLKTKRRKKMVNHGTWDRYEVSLVDPEKNFAVQLNNFQEMENEKVAFDVLVSAKIALESRQSKWIKGVQLYSISADGSASVRLKLSVSLGSKMDVGKFPPDLIFDPSITNAEIELAEFRIDRVSKAGGELAQQVTRVVRKKITQKIEEKENKLVQKLNSRIDKNRDRFRLSVHDAMKSKWAAAGKKLLEKAGSESPNKQEVVPDK